MLGAVPSPCPIVAPFVEFPLQDTTLKPAVGFAETVEVIVPAVLLTPVPLAFQFQDTKVFPVEFQAVFVPIV